jgi:hypothetical protein
LSPSCPLTFNAGFLLALFFDECNMILGHMLGPARCWQGRVVTYNLNAPATILFFHFCSFSEDSFSKTIF